MALMEVNDFVLLHENVCTYSESNYKVTKLDVIIKRQDHMIQVTHFFFTNNCLKSGSRCGYLCVFVVETKMKASTFTVSTLCKLISKISITLALMY